MRDIAISLMNAPRELMLGTKEYSLNFNVMNLRDEPQQLSIEFTSDSLSIDQPSVELQLDPGEKKVITIIVAPTGDGTLDLAVKVDQIKKVSYSAEVLEGHEDEVPSEETSEEISAPAPSKGAPEEESGPSAESETEASSRPPVKPARIPVKPAGVPQKPAGLPVKPAGRPPIKPAGAPQKPAGLPVKPAGRPPIKPAGAPQKPAGRPVKPAGKAPAVPAVRKPAAQVRPAPVQGAIEAETGALLARITSLRDQYMTARNDLDSMTQGSPEYKKTYAAAAKLKTEYEALKARYEAGYTAQEEEAGEAPDLLSELNVLMVKYNELKAKLGSLKQNSAEYKKVKQEAMDVYNSYNEKKAQAKEQGLIA
jgi:hypothetical protein